MAGEQLRFVEPKPKTRSARNVIARALMEGYDGSYEQMRFALLSADLALEALYDAGLRVTPYLCRTCERLDIRAVR